MNYNAGLKSVLLSSSALMLLTALTINAGAANVTVSGDNAWVENPCRYPGVLSPIVTVPEPCPGVTYAPQAPSDGPEFELTDHFQTGIIIGRDGNGEVIITDGGKANTAHLVIGHEASASGSVIISGAGSEYLNHSTTSVGNAGMGELIIRDGGIYRHVNTDFFYAGYEENSDGYVEVSGVAADGQRSTLITRHRIYVGYYGNAMMNILDGGLVSAEFSSVVGDLSGSNSSMLVSGVNAATGLSSTFRVINNQFWIGYAGQGSIDILDGGLVEVGEGFLIAGVPHSKGSLRLDGVNEATGKRSTINSEIFYVGREGEGTATVTGGSVVNSDGMTVGRDVGSDGKLTVSGKYTPLNYKSSVIISGQGHVGRRGIGVLTIDDGGLVDIGGNFTAGYDDSGNGIVNINGTNSELIVSGSSTYIGGTGEAVINLSDNGSFNANGVYIARYASGKGTINIGVGGLSGVMNAPLIHGAAGDATINFNHIDDIDFTPQMTGSLKVNQINSGATTLTTASNYTGLTTISAGALKAGGVNYFSANSHHAVGQYGTLDLNGFDQALSTLNNAGLVRFGGNGGTTLEVSDLYTGAGGVIEFNTVLGNDASVTDRMKAQETAGTTFIRVRNAGGTGAQTSEGIRLIEVDDIGSSTGSFLLLGDYMFEGDQAVVGGAYAYRLYLGAPSDRDDENWYLRSALIPTDPEVPLYQPGVPVYESYAQSLLGLNGLSTMQQRVGNRFWAGDGNRVISQGADTVEYYAPAEEAGVHSQGNGVWGRIEGTHNKVDPKFSSSGTDYSQNVFKMQAGVDMALSETESGTLIGGVFAHYTRGKTKARSLYGDGTISTDGYGFGGTLTWYGNEGFYVDGQAQATWYDSDLSSTLANTSLISGNDGFGYALSLETGKRFAIAPEWSLTPQAQLLYSNVRFDSFDDVWGAHVSLDRGHSLQGRLGVTLDHETSWQNDVGMTDRAHVYGIANLYYGFIEGKKVNVADEQFTQEQQRLWGGLGVGGSYNWNDDKYSIYGEGLVNTSLNSFGDSYTLKGNVGFRVKW